MSKEGETTSEGDAHHDVIVIGAGFSGMYALHHLRDKVGLDVRVLDAAGGVGGTWWYNRYPGARVDAPSSPFYAFTFSKDLADEWDWTETQSDGPTILSYLEHAADRFDLRKDIQFDTRVVEARYDEQGQRWFVRTDAGETMSAQFLISAMGVLYVPNLPDYPGIEHFAGERHHTGRWPHDGVSFSGKRVGVIGTGSSGIQAIPEIAVEAEHVTVFQRTAQYSLPARNRPLRDEELAQSRQSWDEVRATMRRWSGFPFALSRRRSDDFTTDERHAVYEELWEEGGFGLALKSFAGVMTNQDLNEEIGAFVRSKISEIVDDPVAAETLMPRYHFGTKRLILDNGYYETFNRDNVTLVDLNVDPIEEFTPAAVRTARGQHEIDILVLATGFDAVTGSLTTLNPVGRNGVSLQQKWDGRFETYLGTTIPDFPNLFVIHGPGSPGVLFTIPLGSELTTSWIADCIGHVRDGGYGAVGADNEAALAWGSEIDDIANRTLYPLTESWYTGSNVPGKPLQFLAHPNGTAYYDRLFAVADAGFEGLVFEDMRRQ